MAQDLFSHMPEDEWSLVPGYAGNRLDREAEQRSATCLDDALANPEARIYLLHQDRVINRVAPDGLRADFSHKEALGLGLTPESLILLGHDEAIPYLAGLVPEQALDGLDDHHKAIDLRSLAIQGVLAANHMGALAQARSQLHWHDRHGFCANCGSATLKVWGGARRDCPDCKAAHFPRVDPVVIMLVVDGDRCLLGRQHSWPDGMYSALAGFMEPGETMEAAVRREIKEESGLEVGRVRYCASQAWPFPSSLMLGCVAEAKTTEINFDRQELDDCRWFTRKEVRALLPRETTSVSQDTDGVNLYAPTRMSIANLLIRVFEYI
ncbi:NAD(+) diphosphatase [Coralliovum pocilloporae]|uniref:NAD(+) diphosphatase n=1 Tax=Coralliovum pocilloporae TaxID=3066369 RepID=UPI003306C663